MKKFIAAVFLGLFAVSAAPLLADGPGDHPMEHHEVVKHHAVHHRHHVTHHHHAAHHSAAVVHHDQPDHK